ncbi:hypothetical protein FVER14953_20485 [Fusarium verticillioides]|nr:hypothetical protein FVER14953_20485 [Fusarium verticillioides]
MYCLLKHLIDGLLLSDYGIEEGSTLLLALRLSCVHGRNCPCLPPKRKTAPRPETGQAEMAFPFGGVVRQNIVDIPKGLFQESNAVSFNVQILNSATFTAITGLDPPSTPVSAAVYQELGLPFYDLYEEPSRVSGVFSGLKSIAQIEGTPKKALDNLSLIEAETGEPANKYKNGKGKTGDNPAHTTAQKTHGDNSDPKVGSIGLLDPRAPDLEVRFAWDVEAETDTEI